MAHMITILRILHCNIDYVPPAGILLQCLPCNIRNIFHCNIDAIYCGYNVVLFGYNIYLFFYVD